MGTGFGGRMKIAWIVVAIAVLGCTQNGAGRLSTGEFTTDARLSYLKEAERKLGEWNQILENLKSNRNMHPVNSSTYRVRGETIRFLENELAEVWGDYTKLKAAELDWRDYRAPLETKLAQLKERYFRPSAE